MSTITITASLVSLSGSDDVGSCTFELVGFGSTPPVISGSSMITNLVVTAIANGSGDISQVLIPNSAITPAGTTYTVTFYDTNGAFISKARYLLNSSADLSSLTPLPTSI